MSFSVFDVLLIVGITQGLVAAPTLIFAKEKHLSKTLLALAIVSFCLMFIKVLFNFTGLSSIPTFRYLPNAFELTTGPLFYLYLRALTEQNFQWRSELLIHFIPFFIAYAYALLIYSVTSSHVTIESQTDAAYAYFYYEFKELEDWSIVASILLYLILGTRRILTFQTQIKNSNADNSYPTLHWLRSILVACVILWLMLVFNMSVARFTDIRFENHANWIVYYVYVALFTYYLAFMSYRQKVPDLAKLYQPSNDAEIADADKSINPELIQEFETLMMDSKLYLEPTLNLQQVANKLGVSQPILSNAINSHFDKNFRELINAYRLEDIKKKLLNAENKASVLSLALESGFNSEASFYRIFKKDTGLSPTQYITEQRD